jgi:formate hydrogenlyase subunit 4
MMMLFTVEPVMAVALLVAAVKAGSLATGPMVAWHVASGPTISMAVAGLALFLALQAQVGKLPFDIAEADQELMGGPLVEFSGPRLALLKWTVWAKQLVLAFLLVELFLPWPHVGLYPAALLLALVKVLLVLVLVAVIDVVNPRLRVEQAMGYYLRIVLSGAAALAFAVIGL